MDRGRRGGEQIFLEERDYKTFLEFLMEAAQLWNLGIAAYCLMLNHYHLLTRHSRNQNSSYHLSLSLPTTKHWIDTMNPFIFPFYPPVYPPAPSFD